MKTKLGPHCLRGTPDAIRMIQAGARVIKCVDDFGPALDAKRIGPDVLTIGRAFAMYDPMADFTVGRDPTEAAIGFFGMQVEKVKLNPHIDAWEGPNEPVCNTPRKMAWYGLFESARVWLLAAQGKRAVIGNFSVGQPRLDVDVWPEFFPAIRSAVEHGGYLGLHEYSWPVMTWMFGKNQVNPNENQGDEGWVTCRYRKVYRRYLIPNSLAIPLFITECGIDPGVNPKPFRGAGAFREDALRRIWTEHYAMDDPDAFYAGQLLWYDGELKKDDYVAGATVFTVGSFGVPWSNFDVAGTRVIEHLGAAWAAMPDEPDDGDPPPDDGDDEMPTTDTTNLLANADFDDGQHYHWRGVNEIVIPNKWDFWYADHNTKWLPKQDQNFDPPECVVWNKTNADPKEYGFWLSGDYNLKVFKGWGVIWWRLFQKVTGLTVGSKYRFTAPVHPDLVMSYETDGRKIYADDPLAGEVRLSANTAGKVIETGWKTGVSFPFGAYTEHALEFTAEATEVEVSIECRCRWGLNNDGWFVDSPKLVLVDTGPTDGGTEPPTDDDDTVSVLDLLNKALIELGDARAQVTMAEASVKAARDTMVG